MGDVVSFSLTLDERVAGPAKKAAEALRVVEKTADKAQAALSGKFANSWEKIGFAAERSSLKQNNAFAASWAKIGMAAGRAHERTGAAAEKAASRQRGSFADSWGKIGFAAEKAASRQQNSFANSWVKIGMAAERAKRKQHEAMETKKERDAEKAKEHSLLGGIKEGVGFDRFTKAAFLGSVLAEGAMKIGEGLIETAHEVVEIFTEGFKKGLEEAGKEQTRRQQFGLSLGTQGGAESFVDIERFAKQTQFTKDEIQPMMLKLRRAGFDQKSARSTFAVAADIDAAGGMKAADYVDFAEHLKLKGGVSKKQLLSANINVPEFFKALGKSHGISAALAEKQAEEGGHFDPQELLNLIQKGVEKRQGGKAGTGSGVASGRLETRLKKLSALPGEYLEQIVDLPGFKNLSDTFGNLLEKLDPESPTGQRITAALDRMFNKVLDLFGGSDEDVDNIVDGIENMIGLVGDLLPDVGAIAKTFLDAAGAVSDMVANIRFFNAITSGDKEGAAQIMKDRILVSEERKRREIEAEERRTAPTVAGDKAMGRIIHMHNHVAVAVHAAPGEDPNHTHRKMAEETHRHTLNALEKAAQEGGG